MILLLQAVTRLFTLVLLGALALAGLAVAVFSVPSPENGLSELADLLGLHLAREEVHAFLETLESSGGATEAALCFGAALTGAILVAGALLRRSDRAIELPASDEAADSGAGGRLAVRRRALAQMAVALAGRVREAESLGVRLRARRNGPGGRMRVRARLRDVDGTSRSADRIAGELRPLTEPFELRPRVRARPVAARPGAARGDGGGGSR